MKRLLLLIGVAILAFMPNGQPAAQAADSELCYLVADSRDDKVDGASEDQLTRVFIEDFNPDTNRKDIGPGTSTYNVEAISFLPGTYTLFAADAGQLGTINLLTGLFTPRPAPIGSGTGAEGRIAFNDVDGIVYDVREQVIYGSQRRESGDNLPDLLIKIDPTTGTFIPNAFGRGKDYVVIPPIGPNLRDIEELAIDPGTGEMYAIATTGGYGSRLVKVNRSNGQLTDVGPAGFNDIEGMTIDSQGRVWGTTGKDADPAYANKLWEIDKVSGKAGNPRSLDGTNDYESIECNPVKPTAIELVSFTATFTADRVILRWETSSETNTWGFYLLRSSDGTRAGAVQITPELIPAQGRGQGAVYTWEDTTIQPGISYTYWLQELEVEGAINEYGPATNIYAAGAAANRIFVPLIGR